jgi:uncharacterized membrane protein
MYLHKFISKFQYQLDKKDFLMSYKTHPKYPGIVAMSNTFEHYGVSSVLAQVPKDKWEVLPEEFIALVSLEGTSKTVFVSRSTSNEFTVRTTEGKKTKLTQEQFLAAWDGIVLGVNENTMEEEKSSLSPKNYARFYQIAFLVVVIIAPFFIVKDQQLFPWTWFYTLLSFLGLYLNILIIKKKMGFGSDGFKKICSFAKKSSCDDVILSNRNRLFLNVSFSDLSTIYFIFTFLIAFFIESFQLSSELLGFTLLSVPILLYSIFVQVFQLKSICVVCLTMSALTLGHIFLLGMMNGFTFQVDTQAISVIGTLFLGIAFAWMLWKESMNHLEDANEKYMDYHHLIRKQEVFKALEKESESATYDTTQVIPISLNATDHANHEVSIVMSPKCSGCAIAYKDIRKVLSHHSATINASLIFDLRYASDSIKGVFARMIELSQTSSTQFTTALDDWFLKTYSEKRWLQKWGQAQTDVSHVMENHQEFLTYNKIYHSPVIFVDHKQLSQFYSIKDAVYFMNHVVATS